MFRVHVESWLEGKDSFVVEYFKNMLDNGHDTLTDFQEEAKLLTKKMSECDGFNADHQYFWSMRSWVEESIRWYAPL